MGICCSKEGSKREKNRKDKVKYSGKSGGLIEGDLSQVEGRLFSNGYSGKASLFTQQGKKGTNQDAMVVWENFNSRKDTVFCGVFDGHGPYGHMVAKKVRDSLPVLLSSQWKANSNVDQSNNGNTKRSSDLDECADEDWCETLEAEEIEKLPETYQPLKKSLLKAFKLMDKELKFHPVIDCFCSGSTAVTLVKQGEHLILGNVGDSRAVLATRDEDNTLTAVQLTVDLKPNLPREAARIQECKGRVFALQDEPEVSRVWLPTSDTPGLAMARAFGDFCLKDFGLISVPDVYYRHLTQRDEFIVLASDGIWDVISNKEAIDIIASAPGRASAARALVDCATRAWRLKYPTSKIDDCAVICLYLDEFVTAELAPKQNNMPNKTREVEINMPNKTREVDIKTPIANVETNNSEITENIVPLKSMTGEIETVIDDSIEEISPNKNLGHSKRSLAECLSTAEEEEWSALEGITRVNSLLSIPRFASGDKKSGSWRKWL